MYLREKGIDFIEKDVHQDPLARQEFASKGLSGVPSFVIGSEVVVGLDRERMESLLKYRMINCEQCAAKLRVPRGKGKIKIACPKCKHSEIIQS